MSELSWSATKRFVYERANGCCEYCQTCEDNTGQPMHVEHIQPDGGNNPETKESVPLFNPRRQLWNEHFEWFEDGLRVRGTTSIGRATVERLKMNQQRVVRARRNWIVSGNHPPGGK